MRPYILGKVSPLARKLIDVTRALVEALKAVPGNRQYDISSAIQTYERNTVFQLFATMWARNCSAMHEEPRVPILFPRKRPILEEGMVLAIEPMVNTGTWKVRTLEDQWTVVTRDNGLSAHFEHTVAIFNDGPEILTAL